MASAKLARTLFIFFIKILVDKLNKIGRCIKNWQKKSYQNGSF
jgi:hypothetical protein